MGTVCPNCQLHCLSALKKVRSFTDCVFITLNSNDDDSFYYFELHSKLIRFFYLCYVVNDNVIIKLTKTLTFTFGEFIRDE